MCPSPWGLQVVHRPIVRGRFWECEDLTVNEIVRALGPPIFLWGAALSFAKIAMWCSWWLVVPGRVFPRLPLSLLICSWRLLSLVTLFPWRRFFRGGSFSRVALLPWVALFAGELFSW